ncbi:MAG: ankyrin repeat domain-containing protein [Armatimonadota bacterium]
MITILTGCGIYHKSLNSDLTLATVTGNISKVKECVAKGADVNTADIDGYTALQLAASDNHKEITRFLISKGAKVDLLSAAGIGDIQMTRNLVSKGADINTTGKYGDTPLHWASKNGHAKVVAYLLGNGARTDIRTKDIGWTPLHYASDNGHLDVARLLISNKASIDAKDFAGSAPLIYAVTSHRKEMIALLSSLGADINARDDHGMIPLDWAVYKEPVAIVKELLRCGADVKAKDVYKYTPLHWAVRATRNDIAKLLILSGCKPDIYVAAGLGDTDLVKLLLAKKGFDINTQDGLGYTALHWAAECGRVDTATFLIAQGADIDIKSRIGGYTPLHAALYGPGTISLGDPVGERWCGVRREGNKEVARILVLKGADPTVKDNIRHLTPIRLAQICEYKQVYNLMRQKTRK